jgi:hypothetical protein
MIHKRTLNTASYPPLNRFSRVDLKTVGLIIFFASTAFINLKTASTPPLNRFPRAGLKTVGLIFFLYFLLSYFWSDQEHNSESFFQK